MGVWNLCRLLENKQYLVKTNGKNSDPGRFSACCSGNLSLIRGPDCLKVSCDWVHSIIGPVMPCAPCPTFADLYIKRKSNKPRKKWHQFSDLSHAIQRVSQPMEVELLSYDHERLQTCSNVWNINILSLLPYNVLTTKYLSNVRKIGTLYYSNNLQRIVNESPKQKWRYSCDFAYNIK